MARYNPMKKDAILKKLKGINLSDVSRSELEELKKPLEELAKYHREAGADDEKSVWKAVKRNLRSNEPGGLLLSYLNYKSGESESLLSREGFYNPVILLISIVSFLVGIFFLSPNLTGNVIGNLTQTTSNWTGGILFVLGIVGVFYFRKC